MSVSATTQIIEQGPRNLIMHWTGIGDGNGDENKVVKVNVSQLLPPCGSVKIVKVYGTVEYGVVELFWDALTPKKFTEWSGQIEYDMTKSGGLTNPRPNGYTGNILLSTVGFQLSSTYDLYIEMVKKQS